MSPKHTQPHVDRAPNILTDNASLFSTQHSIPAPVCVVDSSVIPAGDVGKCLGYWWKGDLSSSRSVEENIKKARRAFFHFGSIGAFQGDISPLSSREVIETCVMPVHLYGSENWILTETLLQSLKSFQGELARRVLKCSKHHSNTPAVTALDVPTMKCRILVRKLGFLKTVMDRDADCLSGSVVLALCSDVDSLCLVRECSDLEESFGAYFTEMITSKVGCRLKEMKNIVDVDKRMLLEKCAQKAPMIAKVAEHPGWAELWDHSLNLGWKAVLGLQMLSRAMSHHERGKQLCHLCEVETLKEDTVL